MLIAITIFMIEYFSNLNTQNAIPFSEIYDSIDKLNLPDWVQKKINSARIFGKSKQMIIFPDGEKYQINNPLNILLVTV